MTTCNQRLITSSSKPTFDLESPSTAVEGQHAKRIVNKPALAGLDSTGICASRETLYHRGFGHRQGLVRCVYEVAWSPFGSMVLCAVNCSHKNAAGVRSSAISVLAQPRGNPFELGRQVAAVGRLISYQALKDQSSQRIFMRKIRLNDRDRTIS